MGGEQHGDAFIGDDGAEEGEDFVGGFAVEFTCGFVGQDELWFVGDGTGDGDALLLTARHFVGAVTGPFAEANHVQALHGAVVALFARHFGDAQHEFYVFIGGQGGEQAKGLEDEPHFAPSPMGEFFFAETGERTAVYNHIATRRLIQPAQAVEQGGLAAARPSLEGDEAAGGHL